MTCWLILSTGRAWTMQSAGPLTLVIIQTRGTCHLGEGEDGDGDGGPGGGQQASIHPSTSLWEIPTQYSSLHSGQGLWI